MKEIIGINHIGIRVENLDRARKFYEQLGFVFLVGPIGPEPVAIMEHSSGVNINLILNADPGITENILMDVKEKYPGYTHIALDVNDIKAGCSGRNRAFRNCDYRRSYNVAKWRNYVLHTRPR